MIPFFPHHPMTLHHPLLFAPPLYPLPLDGGGEGGGG
jgi:hypothetical protein